MCTTYQGALKAGIMQRKSHVHAHTHVGFVLKQRRDSVILREAYGGSSVERRERAEIINVKLQASMFHTNVCLGVALDSSLPLKPERKLTSPPATETWSLLTRGMGEPRRGFLISDSIG